MRNPRLMAYMDLAMQSNAWSVFPGLKTLASSGARLGRPASGGSSSITRLREFFNLAAEHNRQRVPKLRR